MKGKKSTPGSGDIRGWLKLAKEKTTAEVNNILKEDKRRYNRSKNEKFFGKDGYYDEDEIEEEELEEEWDKEEEVGKDIKKVTNNDGNSGDKMETDEDFSDKDGERREDDKKKSRSEMEAKEVRECNNRKHKNWKMEDKESMKRATSENRETRSRKIGEGEGKKNKEITRQLLVLTGEKDLSSDKGKRQEERMNGRKRGARSNSEVGEGKEKGKKTQEEDKMGGSRKKKQRICVRWMQPKDSKR